MLAAALLALCGRSRPCVAFAWLAGRARRIIIRRRDYIPARLALPAPVNKRPRFAYFPPFWRPFGVAVVSSAGAVSLRPFRWCRCAYKVAAPRVPCFRPCSWPLVSLAAALACWCPCVYISVQYFPHQSQRDKIPPHGRAVCFTSLAAVLVVFGGYCAVSVTGGVTIARQSRAGHWWRGDCAPAVLTLSTCQKTIPPMLAAGGRAGNRAPPKV